MYRTATSAIDQRVREAQVRCAELHRLQARRAALVAELARAEADMAARGKDVVREQADVTKLEKGAWAFLHGLFSDGEQRLSKEKAEAAAAMMRWQEAVAEHARLRRAIEEVDAALAPFAGAEDELARAREAKLDELEARGGAVADELAALEDEAALLAARLAHVAEAETAGGSALVTLGRVEKRLAEAEAWDPMNLILGSDGARLAEADRMDRAYGFAGVAQAEVTMFERELADLGLALRPHAVPAAAPPLQAGQDRFVETVVRNAFAYDRPIFTGGATARHTTRDTIAAVEQGLAAVRAERGRLEARAAHVDARLAALTGGVDDAGAEG